MKSTCVALGCCLLVTGCAYMGVVPDEGAEAFAGVRPSETPLFESAALVVNGSHEGYDRRTYAADLALEKQAWSFIQSAFLEKRLVLKRPGTEEPGDLQVLFEFRLEDDVHPMHRSISTFTLGCFPMWKMVRLEAAARCRVEKVWLPNFHFEEEVLVYYSPVLAPVSPFMGEEPIKRLFRAVGCSLTTHVLREIRRQRLLEAHPDNPLRDDIDSKP